MNIVTMTSLFPGESAPRHGTFVRERMRDYREYTGDQVKVVAPVPYFPRFVRSAKYGHFARTPRSEEFGGFAIDHPRYLMIPKVGVPFQGMCYEIGVRSLIRRYRYDGQCDVLDAHYAYPDGFAAALLKKRLRLPMVLTVRGTDVNHMPSERGLAGQIRFALQTADRVIAVSKSLADCAVAAGADPDRTVVLRNGVDAERFQPRPRDECRRALDLPSDRRVVVSVGFLIPRKGHDLSLRALARIESERRPMLLIAGDGPEEGNLRALIDELGLANDARLLGAVAHDDLSTLYSAADLSLLASSREGWANVLLESMACGTPALASDVHGAAECIRDDAVGRLFTERTPEALCAALTDALAATFDRSAVRRYAESMSWRETSKGLRELFQEVVG